MIYIYPIESIGGEYVGKNVIEMLLMRLQGEL